MRKEHSAAITVLAKILQKFNGLKLLLSVESVTGNNIIVEVGLRKGGISCYYRKVSSNVSVTVMFESVRWALIYHHDEISIRVTGRVYTKDTIISEEVKTASDRSKRTGTVVDSVFCFDIWNPCVPHLSDLVYISRRVKIFKFGTHNSFCLACEVLKGTGMVNIKVRQQDNVNVFRSQSPCCQLLLCSLSRSYLWPIEILKMLWENVIYV